MSSSPAAAASTPEPRQLPHGFRPRRGLNWATVGFMYTSYYFCRYNFAYANKAIKDEFGFTNSDMGTILMWQFIAYGCGQMLNGLLTDRLGGKRAMLIGAVGTIVANVLFGVASFWGMLGLFTLLWGVNGYVQSFGAPGFIKINSAWFSEKQRGTFAGIFGFMINLGRLAANKLLPLLLVGFAIFGMIHVPAQHWRWLFWIPAIITSLVAIIFALVVKDTPEEAGYRDVFKGEADHADTDVRAQLGVVFRHIAGNPMVWVIAAAYACTGAVRQAVDQWFPVYFQEVHHLKMTGTQFQWLGYMIPLVASCGSFVSGWVSDRFFQSRRAPVAMCIYMIEIMVILAATQVHTVNWAILFFVMVSFTVNSTHSLLGPAAAMDIGGRKMAAFASGCIDAFQYFGAALGMKILGYVLDNHGWGYYFYYMVPFGVVGAILMYSISHRKSLKKDAH
ncbi:MFS transporter [Opitutus sp. ER46]|uniref:MFS transporter n=1 Tax=Opitutus sp. ER46 TaxID=2161864 RepID=UPI000D2F7696|nr:MFS transporter [Opitutus sp. ER46]PTX92261.1 MFS transporter [Opitutus sp. ER46]